MKLVNPWSVTRKYLMIIVFIGIHVPLTVLAASFLMASGPVGAMSLLITFLGTALAALITLPAVYILTRDPVANAG